MLRILACEREGAWLLALPEDYGRSQPKAPPLAGLGLRDCCSEFLSRRVVEGLSNISRLPSLAIPAVTTLEDRCHSQFGPVSRPRTRAGDRDIRPAPPRLFDRSARPSPDVQEKETSTSIVCESRRKWPSRSRAKFQFRRPAGEYALLARGTRDLKDPLLRDERARAQGLAGRSRKSSIRSHSVHPAGLEPTTYSSGGCRSIQLSYGCVGGEVRAFRNPNQAVRA